MYDLGIGELPPNNAMDRSILALVSSSNSWYAPLAGSFKLNVDGAAKGNPGPNGYGGAIRNSKGDIISLFSGSIGSNTNNMAELEGLMNGLKWALQIGKTPLVAEGDSQIIINLAHRLQSGTSTAQVSNNWRWEGHLSTLMQTLTGQEAILFSHVKQEGKKVADAMVNKGVESGISFHAEEIDDKGNTQTIWKHC